VGKPFGLPGTSNGASFLLVCRYNKRRFTTVLISTRNTIKLRETPKARKMTFTKKCSKCSLVKNTEDFYKLKNSKDGFDYHCKVCEKERKESRALQLKEYNARYQKDKADKISAQRAQFRAVPENKIKAANRNKAYRDANPEKIAQNKREYQENNSEKIAQQGKEYYEQHKDELLVRSNIYNMENKEKIRAQRAQYRLAHLEEIKKAREAYKMIRNQKNKERLQKDESYRISTTLRTKLHKVLKGNNTSFTDLLGLEKDMLIAWIEFQFEPWMSWDTYATKWQLDHVLPISKFDMTKDLDKRVCFSWMNIQPMCGTQNRSKSNKILLHEFFNSFLSAHRFIQNVGLECQEYQALVERLRWLRATISGMVKSSWMKETDALPTSVTEMGNPQPSL
jgi:hypothetical protein